MEIELHSLEHATDEMERERILSDVLILQTAPLVRKVIRQRLGFYLNYQGANPYQPEAEDLYQDILTKLLQRLNEWLAQPAANPIHNYRNLVITTTINACHDYLRAKSPARARLKNKLRELLTRHQDFKLWNGEGAEKLAGFAVWQGQQKNTDAMERLREWQADPSSFNLVEGDLQRVPFTKLVASILQQVDGPVELEALTNLLIVLLGTREQFVESLEQQQEDLDWQPTTTHLNTELKLEGQAALQALWAEIKQLPAQQRSAVSLSLTDQNGNDLFSILLDAEAVTGTQLANDLGLTPVEFVELWRQLPMENASLAMHLGVTRAQVNKWRWRGLQQLRQRLRKEK